MIARTLLSVVLIATLTSTTTAAAQTSYEVAVGGLHYSGAVRAELMRFYPEDLTIHQGDVLRFTSDATHSVTILPAGADPTGWRLDNASGRGDPWAYLLDDPDDGSGATKYNARYFTPTVEDCGDAGTPCAYDGSGPEPHNSGAPSTGLDHSVAITAAPGTTLWVISLYHQRMNLRIRVVSEGDPASDPTEVATAAEAQRARDIETAEALHGRFAGRTTKHRDPETGRVVRDAWAGVDAAHVSLYGMYPKRLRIRRGQTVRWHFDTLENEIHNVVFPYSEAQEIAFNTFQPVCDPDGDAGPEPDVPADSAEPPFCPIPEQAEIDLDPREARERGNGVFRGNDDVEASGIRGSDDAAGRDPFHEALWDVRFRARSKRGFRYFCTIHGQAMSGRVIVK